jgi:5-methylcytosine-specific restriction enzyme subunit McrC
MATPIRRVGATEYRQSRALLPELRAAGLSREAAVDAVVRTGSRLRRSWRLDDSTSPISVDPDTEAVKFSNVAGVIRIVPGVEVDVAPKFLGHNHPGWREDLLAIANITGEGRILATELVAASYGEARDLASLIGRVFVEQYWANRRRPLHVYRSRAWRGWSLDGELDLTHFPVVVDEDGLPQRAVLLDRRNPYSAVIRAAAEVLVREVTEPDLRTELERAISTKLSKRVLQSFDVALEPGDLWAPGFVVRTWQAWERLIHASYRRELGFARVSYQRPLLFGHRLLSTGVTEKAWVTPDVTVDPDTTPPVLYDAKYKVASGPGPLRVAGTDLQEALAFMSAAGADEITLLYPREADDGPTDPAGRCRAIERVALPGGKSVLALDVEVRGIGVRGGFRAFTRELVSSAAAVKQAFSPSTRVPAPV